MILTESDSRLRTARQTWPSGDDPPKHHTAFEQSGRTSTNCKLNGPILYTIIRSFLFYPSLVFK